MKRLPFYLLDIAAVLSFVIIGRSAHGHADNLGGVFRTSWPFLLGMAVAWGVLSLSKISFSSPLGGVTIVFTIVVVGMTTRVIVGQGTALGFIAVSLAYFSLTSALVRIVFTLFHRRSSLKKAV
ncbi:Protein of unknown function [Ferrithrix thermotolerans DSM 19514]|uniref:DUF3054 domain-containing protein n=1 Tax=Ferrithrix thermotolerans DSM 19514 TaxID=1121881 RepID=A0A1M4U8S3_9ACTN|nr:DUF3054 domain-containing protein [Ferrithrix thermotolerans]SHE53115.1 Protein of unknown function [Ferrithrix thermotolerans DSM 19514]